MRYTQGEVTNPPLTASFRDSSGLPVTPLNPRVQVFDSQDALVFDAIPDFPQVGEGTFAPVLAVDAQLGLWRINWSGFINGAFAEDDDFFEVVPAGALVTTLSLSLRRMLGDRIPVGATDADTFFSDSEIAELLAENNDDLNRAALSGWGTKMAEFAKLVDRDESGSTRRMSQMFKQAEAMVNHYSTLAGLETAAVVGRVVGRAVNLREEPPSARVMASSATYRGLSDPSERARFQADNPETAAEDPTYPASTPQAG